MIVKLLGTYRVYKPKYTFDTSLLLSELVNRLIPSYFFFVIILQKMSNPDGDEDMNSAQSHYIVAQGDISHEKKSGFWQGVLWAAHRAPALYYKFGSILS